MSKRQAETDLNHDNWDDEDPVENSNDQCDNENGSGFKMASKNILEKRVIRTAKRRSQATGDEPKKSVFGGFGGFMKTPPASFDFLSKLTNSNNDNSSSTTKMDSPVTSSLFTSKKPATSPNAGLFSLQTSSNTPSTSPFASPSTQIKTSNIFGVSSTNTNPATNMFITSKADSTVVDSPFKMQTVTSSTDMTDFSKSTATTTLASTTKLDIPTSSSNAKSLFSSNSNSSPFKIQTNTVQNEFEMKTKSQSNSTGTEKKSGDSQNDSEMKYYSKLKGLNESVFDWIKKHVEQTPLCILTPIFKDYEKYLKEIQEEYQIIGKENKNDDKSDNRMDVAKIASTMTKTNVTGPTLFNMPQSSTSVFASQNNGTLGGNKSASFSFGINASATSTSSTITTSSLGFKFGVTTASSQSTTSISSPFSSGTTSSSFSFATNINTATNESSAPFSFGTGKPFSFNNIKQNTETTEEATKEDDDDSPPKVEYTPVVEENSIYDKKCKIFVKKENNFVDKGVGTLYIKKIEETGKHQLLVRANTNLGTILVNLILVAGIPMQRMGKNNVMMVCIPTPESKPPPTPILIRVKSSEEADELLATLEKHKT
ncbi:unnamed protein product [Arctia plantaginis]|uniref:RanBD1 domain-containing protein n=1 Tax=Arctia plantaginis TaxID=874455 RepID=A0A8S0ZCD7_ARCPL|nr:unnamed protein product [Arctia plantaginis]